MDMPVNVPVDNPNADTEWNDILRQHGVIPEKPPSPTPMIEEALVEARKLAHENRLECKNMDELDELEDGEDDAFLDQYRKQRMKELSILAKTSIYNQVFPLQKAEYASEVTQVSHESFVFVLLTSSLGTNIESALLTNIWRELAARFGDIKLCQIRADLCIEGYPERNTPTVLIYKDGDIKRQIVTLKELRGEHTSTKDFEKVLLDLGAVNHNDARLQQRFGDNDDTENSKVRQGRNAAATNDDSDDSDWE